MPKMPPEAGVGVRVTVVPAGNSAEHLSSSFPHEIPCGVLTTVPGPPTASDRRAVVRTNAAFTVFEASTTTKHLGDVPTQPPDQWSNAKKRAGVACNETRAPRR
jgi:hypothetical protein